MKPTRSGERGPEADISSRTSLPTPSPAFDQQSRYTSSATPAPSISSIGPSASVVGAAAPYAVPSVGFFAPPWVPAYPPPYSYPVPFMPAPAYAAIPSSHSQQSRHDNAAETAVPTNAQHMWQPQNEAQRVGRHRTVPFSSLMPFSAHDSLHVVPACSTTIQQPNSNAYSQSQSRTARSPTPVAAHGFHTRPAWHAHSRLSARRPSAVYVQHGAEPICSKPSRPHASAAPIAMATTTAISVRSLPCVYPAHGTIAFEPAAISTESLDARASRTGCVFPECSNVSPRAVAFAPFCVPDQHAFFQWRVSCQSPYQPPSEHASQRSRGFPSTL